MMNIRFFNETDRSTLREIYFESRIHAFPWIKRYLFQIDDFERDTEDEVIWVATEHDQPVGFISVWKPENFIHNLFVRPDMLGRGIGSALLREALNHIGRPAALKCVAQNTSARKFYLSKGWKVMGDGKSSRGRYLLMHYNGE